MASSIPPQSESGESRSHTEKREPEIIPVPPSQTTSHLPTSEKATGILPATIVLIFAFFLASTPARNSDFWLDLATGKALLNGTYHFGNEPFTNQETGYWANLAWLYDVLLFLAYQTIGGTLLVVLKCILVVLLAAFMLFTGRSGKNFFVPAFTVAVALLILGPWLSLKSICFSFFFLAWTIWYLEDRMSSSEKLPKSIASFWPMLAVFGLWANLDGWFFLGPLIVGLYFLGSLIPPKTPGNMGGQTLGLLFLASLAVCLFNPHHFRIFLVPLQMEFSGLWNLRQDPLLRNMIIAPFGDYFFSWSKFPNPPGLAFWVMAICGLFSFLIHYGHWPWRWGLTWACFFLWSLLQTQAIPFFAIVSGPFVARNLAQLANRPGHMWSGLNVGKRILRAFTTVVLFAAVVTAWPGWLQIGLHGPRAWGVESDQTMQNLGEQFARWREQGLATNNVFNFSPETGNYLAWFCPQVKCFTNSHLQLSAQEAADYLTVRKGLGAGTFLADSNRDWRDVLRHNEIGILIVHGKDIQSRLNVVKNLFPAFKECPLLALRGSAAIFGWRDPAKPPRPDPFAGLQLSLKREAFSFRIQSEISWEDQILAPLKWWDAFWRPRSLPSADQDEAASFLTFFDSARDQQMQENILVGNYFHCPDVVASAVPAGAAPWNLLIHVRLKNDLIASFLRGQDDGPKEALYLALQACRRALRSNPNDAQAHYLLGETFARLGQYTRERSWGTMLHNIRSCQFLAAFHQAVKLQPDNWQAHDRLAEMFHAMNFKDLTLRHLREEYKYRAAALRRQGSQEQGILGHLKKAISSLEKEVQTLEERFAVNSANLRVVDRVELAGRLGLAGKALAILLKSDIAAFGSKGLDTELKLLLNTGEVQTAKIWLDPEHKQSLGVGNYYWISARIEAALGNYHHAKTALAKMVGFQGPGKRLITSRTLLAMTVGNTLLHEAAGGLMKKLPVPLLTELPGEEFLPAEISFAVTLMDREAKALVLQGFLAVETGANKKATELFRGALLFWDSPAGVPFRNTISSAGYNMTRHFLEILDRENPEFKNDPRLRAK